MPTQIPIWLQGSLQVLYLNSMLFHVLLNINELTLIPNTKHLLCAGYTQKSVQIFQSLNPSIVHLQVSFLWCVINYRNHKLLIISKKKKKKCLSDFSSPLMKFQGRALHLLLKKNHLYLFPLGNIPDKNLFYNNILPLELYFPVSFSQMWKDSPNLQWLSEN